jgi:hypothetical protein
MLLKEADLPTDRNWKAVFESSHRTGAGTLHTSDPIRRAREARSAAADRRFVDPGRMRWVLSSVSGFANEEDAASQKDLLLGNVVRKPFSQYSIVESRVLSEHEIGTVSAPLVYEELLTGPNGPETTQLVAGTIEHVLFLIACTAKDDAWDWLAVNTLVGAQVDRIRSALS